MASRNKTIDFSLTYETACSLQSILTQHGVLMDEAQSVAAKEEFEEIKKFYNYLTIFVEKNS